MVTISSMPSSMFRPSSALRTAAGSGSDAASVLTAIRIWPICAAAWSPLPMTSPTTSATSPSRRTRQSYQSPPTSTPSTAGT